MTNAASSLLFLHHSSSASFFLHLFFSSFAAVTTTTDTKSPPLSNVINLHSDLLSGLIPPQLGLLAHLSVFNVSYNRLEGEILSSLGNLSGMAVRFNASLFAGNKGLYRYPLGEVRGGVGTGGGLPVIAIVGIRLANLIISLRGYAFG